MDDETYYLASSMLDRLGGYLVALGMIHPGDVAVVSNMYYLCLYSMEAKLKFTYLTYTTLN